MTYPGTQLVQSIVVPLRSKERAQKGCGLRIGARLLRQRRIAPCLSPLRTKHSDSQRSTQLPCPFVFSQPTAPFSYTPPAHPQSVQAVTKSTTAGASSRVGRARPPMRFLVATDLEPCRAGEPVPGFRPFVPSPLLAPPLPPPVRPTSCITLRAKKYNECSSSPRLCSPCSISKRWSVLNGVESE
jgi:hypothetical protein